MSKENTKLLPCPFLPCKGQGKVQFNAGIYYVYCLNCGRHTDAHKTEQEAIIAWNTRVEQPKIKIFKCKHFRGYSQVVPMPFGVGSCSEPLGNCAIESESEDCTFECPDYCVEQQPEAGEFVKKVREWLHNIDRLEGVNKQWKKHSNILSQEVQVLEAQLADVKAENKQLRAVKCPPVIEGDCLCPIAELEAELEQQRWIPVSERPPESDKNSHSKQSKWVQLFTVGEKIVEAFYDYHYKLWFDEKGLVVEGTHWKPIILPALKEQDNATVSI